MTAGRRNLYSLKKRLLAHIRGARWRGESDMARRFGDRVVMKGRGRNRHAEDPLVSDALFELVWERKIEWFGAEHRPDRPLRYRITRAAATEQVPP